jgi:hypothetical protein
MSFDASYLFPMPSFDGDLRHEEEVEKVSGELRALFLKNKIKKISDKLKKGEKNEDLKEAENLEKELTSTIALLGKP